MKKVFIFITLFISINIVIPCVTSHAAIVVPMSVCNDPDTCEPGSGGGTNPTTFTLYINTTNRYTVTGSIINMLQNSTYNDNDIYKFYLVLKELNDSPTEFSTRSSLELLLQNKQVNFVRSYTSVTSYTAAPILVYSDFNQNYMNAKLKLEATNYTTHVKTMIESHLDYRSLTDNQTQYGYPADYNPFFTFDYKSRTTESPFSITLIDDDKALFSYHSNETFIKLSMNDHYNRNQYNLSFPNNLSDFMLYYKNQYSCTQIFGFDPFAPFTNELYFYKLGNFDGDTSNINNAKYTCPDHSNPQYPDASYEVIYTSDDPVTAVKVTNQNVMGTYNFYDPKLSCLTFDLGADQIPYLLWGNGFLDDTTLKERFIWDENYSATGIYNTDGKKLYMHRGNTLYSLGGYNSYMNDTIMQQLQYRLE